MAKKMGYQQPLYYGAKGSTASTEVLNCVDVSYDLGIETGSTTSRGDGTSVPIETGEVTTLTPKLTFNMIVDDGDATLTALIAAARTGLAVALKYETFDCDCVLSMTNGSPLKGEQTIDFNVETVSASDRDPSL